jgi:hypothetical protein
VRVLRIVESRQVVEFVEAERFQMEKRHSPFNADRPAVEADELDD